MNDETEPQRPTYSNFVSAAMEFLTARPNATVLIVTESAVGFETFCSTASPIWRLGAAEAAGEQCRDLLHEMHLITKKQSDAIREEEQERIDRSQQRDKGKAN